MVQTHFSLICFVMEASLLKVVKNPASSSRVRPFQTWNVQDYIQQFSTIQHVSLSNTSLKISRRIKQNGLLIGSMSVLLVELASLCNDLPSTDCE